jgi:hypothetical protein
VIIIQSCVAVMVAGKKETASAPIPHGKHPISQQVIRAGFPPLLVGSQDQGPVWRGGTFRMSHPQSVTEFLAIIEPGPCGEDQVPSKIPQRQRFMDRFRSVVREKVSEANSTFMP